MNPEAAPTPEETHEQKVERAASKIADALQVAHSSGIYRGEWIALKASMRGSRPSITKQRRLAALRQMSEQLAHKIGLELKDWPDD